MAICSTRQHVVLYVTTVTSYFALSQGARCAHMYSPQQGGRSAAWELAACDPLTPCKRLNGLFNAHPEETCQRPFYSRESTSSSRRRYRTVVSAASIDSRDIARRRISHLLFSALFEGKMPFPSNVRSLIKYSPLPWMQMRLSRALTVHVPNISRCNSNETLSA